MQSLTGTIFGHQVRDYASQPNEHVLPNLLCFWDLSQTEQQMAIRKAGAPGWRLLKPLLLIEPSQLKEKVETICILDLPKHLRGAFSLHACLEEILHQLQKTEMGLPKLMWVYVAYLLIARSSHEVLSGEITYLIELQAYLGDEFPSFIEGTLRQMIRHVFKMQNVYKLYRLSFNQHYNLANPDFWERSLPGSTPTFPLFQKADAIPFESLFSLGGANPILGDDLCHFLDSPLATLPWSEFWFLLQGQFRHTPHFDECMRRFNRLCGYCVSTLIDDNPYLQQANLEKWIDIFRDITERKGKVLGGYALLEALEYHRELFSQVWSRISPPRVLIYNRCSRLFSDYPTPKDTYTNPLDLLFQIDLLWKISQQAEDYRVNLFDLKKAFKLAQTQIVQDPLLTTLSNTLDTWPSRKHLILEKRLNPTDFNFFQNLLSEFFSDAPPKSFEKRDLIE